MCLAPAVSAACASHWRCLNLLSVISQAVFSTHLLLLLCLLSVFPARSHRSGRDVRIEHLSDRRRMPLSCRLDVDLALETLKMGMQIFCVILFACPCP